MSVNILAPLHPRSGGTADHPRFRHALGYAAGKVLANPRRQVASDCTDRQGHAHFRLHAGSGAGSGPVGRRRGRDAGRPHADPGDRLPDAGAAPGGRCRHFRLAQSAPRQRHQVLFRPGHQAAGQRGTGNRGGARRTHGLRAIGQAGRAKRLDDAQAATSKFARAPFRTNWTCVA